MTLPMFSHLLLNFSSGNVSKNCAVCALAVPTCVPARVRFLRVKGSNKTTVSPYSQCEGKCESHDSMLCSTRYLPVANTPSTPKPSLLGELRHWPDLDFPVYLLCLRLWMCCSRCHSDNMWIKLSLTLPLRKDIQVQARDVTLLPSSLSMIKLIL